MTNVFDGTLVSCNGAIVFERHNVGKQYFQGEIDEFRPYKELLTDAKLDVIRVKEIPTAISNAELAGRSRIVNPL
ncbi:MAG: hypothetical protein JEZ14_22410 [Marinilabiliaceae bacterium]|nr:hypothetical protein [Marinilabiliaceae bacterium]